MESSPAAAAVPRALVLANAVVAGVSAGLAVLGSVRPGYVEPAGSDRRSSPDRLTRFWSVASAIRTLAIVGPLLGRAVTQQSPNSDLLAVAGLVQLGDAALGVVRRDPGMTVLPALAGTLHLLSARSPRRPAVTVGQPSP